MHREFDYPSRYRDVRVRLFVSRPKQSRQSLARTLSVHDLAGLRGLIVNCDGDMQYLGVPSEFG
jgi:hypothetical protein